MKFEEQRTMTLVGNGTEYVLAYLSGGYDEFWNRLSQTQVPGSPGTPPENTLAYDEATNRITTPGYSYDLNGNLTAMPGVSNMTYDVFNRVVSTTVAGGQARAAKYDAFSRRVERQISAEITRVYFYDLGGRMLAEYDYIGSGAPPSRKYEYFAGQRVGYYTDRVGSVRYLEGVGWRHYYPFGEEITGTSNDTYKFADTYRDSDTALDYAMARHYASSIGRFTSVDQGGADATSPVSWNKYAYAHDDPVNKGDTRGAFPCWFDGDNFADVYLGQPCGCSGGEGFLGIPSVTACERYSWLPFPFAAREPRPGCSISFKKSGEPIGQDASAVPSLHAPSTNTLGEYAVPLKAGDYDPAAGWYFAFQGTISFNTDLGWEISISVDVNGWTEWESAHGVRIKEPISVANQWDFPEYGFFTIDSDSFRWIDLPGRAMFSADKNAWVRNADIKFEFKAWATRQNSRGCSKTLRLHLRIKEGAHGNESRSFELQAGVARLRADDRGCGKQRPCLRLAGSRV